MRDITSYQTALNIWNSYSDLMACKDPKAQKLALEAQHLYETLKRTKDFESSFLEAQRSILEKMLEDQ